LPKFDDKETKQFKLPSISDSNLNENGDRGDNETAPDTNTIAITDDDFVISDEGFKPTSEYKNYDKTETVSTDDDDEIVFSDEGYIKKSGEAPAGS
jgi:hypothetical protein